MDSYNCIKRVLLIFIFFIFVMMSPVISISSDYCIVFKSGKKLLVDDHWEEEGKIFFEVDDLTKSINKSKIKTIIDTESYNYEKNRIKKLQKNDLSNFESDGGILYLKDNMKYIVRKSWVEGSNIAFLINNKIIYLSQNKIRKFNPFENGIKTTSIDETYYESTKNKKFKDSFRKSINSNSSYREDSQIKKLELKIAKQNKIIRKAIDTSGYCNSKVKKYENLRKESKRVEWMERARYSKAKVAREQIHLNKLKKDLYLLKKSSKN